VVVRPTSIFFFPSSQLDLEFFKNCAHRICQNWLNLPEKNEAMVSQLASATEGLEGPDRWVPTQW
jgi:hypothetical protein